MFFFFLSVFVIRLHVVYVISKSCVQRIFREYNLIKVLSSLAIKHHAKILTIPSEDLSILKVLYSSIGSSAVYGPRANNIGTTMLRNSSKVLTGIGAPLFFNGAYVLVLILGVRPLYLNS